MVVTYSLGRKNSIFKVSGTCPRYTYNPDESHLWNFLEPPRPKGERVNILPPPGNLHPQVIKQLWGSVLSPWERRRFCVPICVSSRFKLDTARSHRVPPSLDGMSSKCDSLGRLKRDVKLSVSCGDEGGGESSTFMNNFS